jgi:aspartyl protease family protein
MIALGLVLGFLWPTGEPSAADATTSSQKREVVLTRGSTGHFFTDARINGKGSVKFMVDTGASVVALTVQDATRLGIPFNPADFEDVGEGASGPVRGQVVTLESVDVGGIRSKHVRAMILEGSNLSLLGQSFLSHVDHVEISGDYLALREDS